MSGAYLARAGNDGGGHGAVYVFTEPTSGWNGALHQSAKLTALNAKAAEHLGVSVAIDGDLVIAGAEGTTVDGKPLQGSVYVFSRRPGGWSGSVKEVEAPDGASDDRLGAVVALSGNMVLAGSKRDDIGSGDGLGVAYLFVADPPVAASMQGPATLALGLALLAIVLLRRRV